ncbi:hypothetical protein FRC18_001407 [Serendipita sp. 400]|nr:hypothetical protein FRC18_001407 [Serendipita sp. 400]
MNASELYDYDVSTPTATATANGGTTSTTNEPSVESARPTLNEEVQQALGVLGGFWSGFRKQVSFSLLIHEKVCTVLRPLIPNVSFSDALFSLLDSCILFGTRHMPRLICLSSVARYLTITRAL